MAVCLTLLLQNKHLNPAGAISLINDYLSSELGISVIIIYRNIDLDFDFNWMNLQKVMGFRWGFPLSSTRDDAPWRPQVHTMTKIPTVKIKVIVSSVSYTFELYSKIMITTMSMNTQQIFSWGNCTNSNSVWHNGAVCHQRTWLTIMMTSKWAR